MTVKTKNEMRRNIKKIQTYLKFEIEDIIYCIWFFFFINKYLYVLQVNKRKNSFILFNHYNYIYLPLIIYLFK